MSVVEAQASLFFALRAYPRCGREATQEHGLTVWAADVLVCPILIRARVLRALARAVQSHILGERNPDERPGHPAAGQHVAE